MNELLKWDAPMIRCSKDYVGHGVRDKWEDSGLRRRIGEHRVTQGKPRRGDG